MPSLLRMPEVAANATEAVLAEWIVRERDSFDATTVIATVETEKAVVDVEAETAGVLLKTLVPPGSSVDVGAPIAVLGTQGESVDDLDRVLAELGVEDAAGTPAAPRREVPDQPTTAEPTTNADAKPRQPVPNGSGRRIFTSPLARRLARDAGISVEEIRGTGPHGRILRRDVEAAAAHRSDVTDARVATDVPPAPVDGAALAGDGQVDAPRLDAGPVEVPHSRMRRAVAARLTESKQTVPHFYVRATVRAGRLLKLRERLNDGAEQRVSVNDLLVKAVARAHRRVPEMNVTWTPEAVRRHSSVDVAVAVATDEGLLTPVLREVERRSVTDVAVQTRALAERARAGALRQDEIEGGTIAVTNLGMFGVEEFAAIINPPHASILAVGAVREEPVVNRGRVEVASVIRLTLSVDHRPVDGVVAARWLAAFVALLENPVQILA